MSSVIHFTQEALSEDKLAAYGTVLVDFWASWCGPCRMLSPVIDELSDELKGKVLVGKLNVDDYTRFAVGLGVTSIPTLILFRNGREAGRLIGAQPKQAILDLIDKN